MLNSLLAIKVTVRVLKEFKVDIALKTLFEAPRSPGWQR